jgi:hypothetical protein
MSLRKIIENTRITQFEEAFVHGECRQDRKVVYTHDISVPAPLGAKY